MYANTDTLAAEAYRKCFPDGYEIIPTPGIGLYCGFAAVIKTMETMHPDIPLPTIEELLEIFNTEDVQEEIAPFLLDNVNNFTADEVGLVLRLWGECFFLNLRLGYIVGDAAYLVPQDGEAIIIWIHNDNAEALDGESTSPISESTNPVSESTSPIIDPISDPMDITLEELLIDYLLGKYDDPDMA